MSARKKTPRLFVAFVLPVISLTIAFPIWGGSVLLHNVMPTLPTLAWWPTYAFTVLVHSLTYAFSESLEELGAAL